ncbi:MAG: hypothetical protein IIX01_04725, partial [Clostridia bacterium]|nr:hypothetical protein [Clostridia bacterium]
MRKTFHYILGMTVSVVAGLGFSVRPFFYTTAAAESKEVYIGGVTAGFSLSTGGAQVIGLCDVVTDQGACSPAKIGGIQPGDLLKKAAGIRISKIGDLNEVLSKNKEKTMEIELVRGEKELVLTVRPVKDQATGKYKIGVLIRDSVSGIGTVTYIQKDGKRFGSLGHAVCDESKKELGIGDGAVYSCSIVGVNKGIRGRAG